MRRNSAIKKLLKIFLFNFLYIFTIKIFLKNTLLCLDSQKKERRRQVSAFPAIFKADFGRFRQVSAVSGLFRPYRPPADTTRYGRYGPILAKSARFGANRSRFGTNRAASARIELSRRESKKKKKNADADRRAGNRVGHGCGTSGAASVLSRPTLTFKPIIASKKINTIQHHNTNHKIVGP